MWITYNLKDCQYSRLDSVVKKITPLAVFTAHEDGHRVCGHTDGYISEQQILRREREAWKVAIRTLKANNEWDAEAEQCAVVCLSTYYMWFYPPVRAVKLALRFIQRLSTAVQG